MKKLICPFCNENTSESIADFATHLAKKGNTKPVLVCQSCLNMIVVKSIETDHPVCKRMSQDDWEDLVNKGANTEGNAFETALQALDVLRSMRGINLRPSQFGSKPASSSPAKPSSVDDYM